MSHYLSPVVEAQDLGVRPVEGVQLHKTACTDRQDTEKSMRVSSGVAKRAHDLVIVDARRLGHRLRHAIQRDVERGKAVLADRELAQKAVIPELVIYEETHDRGRDFRGRRRNARDHRGQGAGHVDASEVSIGRNTPWMRDCGSR